MSQLAQTWQNLDLQRRIVLVGAILLTFAAVFSVAQIASRPGMALLYSGLDPAAAGEVVVGRMDGSVEHYKLPANYSSLANSALVFLLLEKLNLAR